VVIRVADAAPRVEPLVKHAQLGLVRRHEREADGGAEESGAWDESRRAVAVPAQHVLSDAAPLLDRG